MIRGFYRDRIQGVSPMSYTGRRRYQQMANARGKLNGRACQLTAEEIAAIELEAGERREAERAHAAKAAERIHHPAIPMPEHKCFKVLRRWKGEDFADCIGIFRSEGEALLRLTKELGWAMVTDPNGRRLAHNGQPMTEKPR